MGAAIRPRRLAARVAALALPLCFFTDAAFAQSSACERLKETLAARIDRSIGPFTLEIVPARAPMAPGAKAIGTCEGGARKVVLRRGSAALASAEADTTEKPVPVRASERRESAASAPAAVVAPLPARKETAAPRVIASAAASQAVTAASPAIAPRVVSPIASRAITPHAADAAPVEAPPTTPRFTAHLSPFLAAYWPWLLALVALPVAGWLWAWIAYRRAYDASGLPRGPRLN